MSDTAASLNELIELLLDGVRFYDDAAVTTENPQYQALFQQMAGSKRAILGDLKAQVASHGERPAAAGTVVGVLRQRYADLRARLSANPDAQYVGELEQAEDRILRAFQDALTLSDRAEVRRIAQTYLPDIKRMHDEMRDLKSELKSAA